MELAVDETTLRPYQKQIKYYLDTEGDLNIVLVNCHLGTMVGVSSSTKTLKESGKRTLSDVFGIRNSSALRNLKDDGTVIRMPLLVDGRPATLVGARYSFVKANPEMFPNADLSWIESAKSFTDEALESLSEGDAAIIVEYYDAPDGNVIHTFEDCDDCYDAFIDICNGLETEASKHPGSAVEYPKGKDLYDDRLEEGHFDRGNEIVTLVDGLRTSRITMVNCNYC